MHQQLVSRVSHQKLVKLQLLESDGVGVCTCRRTPLVEFIEQVFAQHVLEARRRWLVAIWQRNFVAIMQLDEQQRHHVVQVIDDSHHVILLRLASLRKKKISNDNAHRGRTAEGLDTQVTIVNFPAIQCDTAQHNESFVISAHRKPTQQ